MAIPALPVALHQITRFTAAARTLIEPSGFATSDLIMLRSLIDSELTRRAEADPSLLVVLMPPAPSASLPRAVATIQGILRARQHRLGQQRGRELSVEVTARDITVFMGPSPVAVAADIGEALRSLDERLSVVMPREMAEA